MYAFDFPPSDLTLRPVTQKQTENCLATVYLQGKPQLSIESPLGFFNTPLPPSFSSCDLHIEGEYVLLHTPSQIAVFTKTCHLLLLERVLNYSFDGNRLTATLPLSDTLGRTANCVWEFTGESCRQTKFTLSAPQRENCLEELLPYAFFDCILLQGDYASLLHESIREDAESIRAFLGDFISVILTNTPTVCGLVRKKGERIFQVDYFSVEIYEGKIKDVQG